MVLAQNIYKSTKRIGSSEEKIILVLVNYFRNRGYEVIPHSSLNFAWGSVLSDVDILLLKDQLLTYVEVKSVRDNIARARKQIDRIMDYVDYAYVATSKKTTTFEMDGVGLLTVDEDAVTVIKKPKRFKTKPRFYSVVTLKKKCLLRFFGFGKHYDIAATKYDLAQAVYQKNKCLCTRDVLKEIVTCGDQCSCCPIDGIRAK